MRRLRLVLIGLAVPALLFLGLKTPVVDRYLEGAAPRWAAAAGYQLRLDSLDFDPWGPRLEVVGLEARPLEGGPGWVVSLQRGQVRLWALRSLLGTPRLSVELRAPRVHGELSAPGRDRSGRGGSGGGISLPAVVFRQLEITDGRASLSVPARDLEVEVPILGVQWGKSRGSARAENITLRWKGASERLQRVEFLGERRFAATQVDRLLLSGPRLQLEASGRVGPWSLLDLSVQGEASFDDLPAVWLEALGLERYAPVTGSAAIDGELKGRIRDPRFEGTLRVSRGRFGPVTGAELSARLVVDEEGLKARDVSGSSNVAGLEQVQARLRWGPELYLEAEGRVRDYRLRPFMGLFVSGDFPVDLTVGGTFRAEGPLYPELELKCSGDARVRDLAVFSQEDEAPRSTYFELPSAEVRTEVTVRKRDLTVGPSRVASDSLLLEVPRGHITYREGMRFETRGEIRDLDIVRRYVPAGFDARGVARGGFGGPYRELRFEYDLDLESTVILGQQLGRLQGHAEYDLRDLVVSRARLDGPLGVLRTKGRGTLRSGGEHNWRVDWQQGELQQIAEIARDLGVPLPLQPGGAVAARGRVVGPLLEPHFEGWVEVTDLRVDGVAAERVLAGGRAGRREWDLRWGQADLWGAEILGTGDGDREGFDARFTVRRLSLEEAAQRLGSDLPVSGVFDGEANAFGAYGDPTVTLSGAVRDASAFAASLGEVNLDLFARKSRLEFRASGLEERLHAEGEVDLRDRRSFQVRGRAEGLPWNALPPHLPTEPWRAQSLSATLQAQGREEEAGWRLTRAEGKGSVHGLTWQELQLGEVRFSGEYDAGAVELTATAWDEALRAEAMLALAEGTPLEISAVFDALPLSQLQPYLPFRQGILSGAGSALLGLDDLLSRQGPQRLSALAELDLQARVSGLRDARGDELPEVELSAASPGGLPEVEVATEGLQLHAGLMDLQQLSWRLTGRADGFVPWRFVPPEHPLADLRGGVSGEWSAAGSAGRIAEASGSGRLQGLAWRWVGPTLWDWSARFDGRRWEGELQEPRGVHAAGQWSSQQGLQARVSLQDAPLAGWVEHPSIPADLTGSATGSAELDWSAGSSPVVDLALQRLTLEQPPLRLANDEEVRIRYDASGVQVRSLSLADDGLWVRARGGFDPGASWDLSAEGRLKLSSVARWLPQVERAAGVAELDAELSGPWAQPDVSGSLEVIAGASVKFAQLPIALEDLDAYVVLEDSQRLTVDWLDARVRDGRLHLEGGMDLKDWQPGELRFYTEIRDLEYQWPAQVSYRFDADGLVTGTVTKPQVRGEVRLEEFLYAKRINWTDLIVKALERKARDVRNREVEEGVYLDVVVRGDEDLRVDNNLSDLALAVDLRVRGYLPNPTLWGRVDVLDGEVRFRGREYETLRSSIEFLGETQPAPLLDLHTRTETRDYTINVDVVGPLDDYEVTLSSVPYLSHTDIVALLTLGATTEELAGGGGVGTTEAAQFLSERFNEQLDPVRSVFGIDTFHIDPSYSPAAQTTVPKVTVGKTVTEEISARYSASMGGESEQYLELEYALTPRLSLFGTWADRNTQEEGSLGGEVRFRFSFR